MDLKRKLEFEQEEEDEWEREVGHLTKKPAHNPYATHVEVLDKQFKDLIICINWILITEGELETLDTSLIIPGGRRTRGKKIDYKQFGADPEDDDE
ncbi:hypothetical protein G6F32_004090 [Rhizopus arrhizus]|nr:hypothetical protein G6F32_004090 [Rhizopus arrhizus]